MLNWSRITDDTAMCALMHALVAHGDRQHWNPWLPTRAGSDLAIDARSGDGRTVYQSKYHQPTESPSVILRDARKEAVAIRRARATEAGAKAWAGVTEWVLVTSLQANTQIYTRWREEIVPLFADLGLSATLWAEGKIATKLVSLPGVRAHFFGGEDWCFESLLELRDRLLSDQQMPATPSESSATLVDVVGREKELAEVATLLSGPQRYFELVGVGGVGKTRFLFEAGRAAMEAGRFDHCVFGLIQAMSSPAHWAQHLPTGRVLVLVDEPGPALLPRIQEEAARPRIDGPTFLVALRPAEAGKSRVGHVEPWRGARIKLSSLPRDPARALARTVLTYLLGPAQRIRDHVVQEIARICDGLPVWIWAAASTVTAGRDLPKTLESLTRDSVDAALASLKAAGVPASTSECVLQWLALFQPLRRDSAIDNISTAMSVSADEVEHVLAALERTGLVRQRGRFVEIRPDTLADAIVRFWLLQPATGGQPVGLSRAGRSFVARLLGEPDAPPLPEVEGILERLARVESLAGAPSELLDRVLKHILQEAQAAPDARAQKRILTRVSPLAGFRPSEVVDVLAALRERDDVPAFREELLPGFASETTRKEVLLALPWAVLGAGCGADVEHEVRKVFDELIKLVRIEASLLGDDPLRTRNDGKRAFAIVERLVLPGREHPASYVNAAWRVLEPLLGRLTEAESMPNPDLVVIRAIAKPLFRREFHDHDLDGNTMRVTRVRIDGGRMDHVRAPAREALWKVVESCSAAPEHKRLAWKLLDEAHRENPDVRANDLERLARLLEAGATPVDAWESRPFWYRYLEYDRGPEFQPLANRCFAAFRQHRDVYDLAQLARLVEDGPVSSGEEPAGPSIIERLVNANAANLRSALEARLAIAAQVGDDTALRRGVFQLAVDIAWAGWQKPAVLEVCRRYLTEDAPASAELGLAIAVGHIARAAKEFDGAAFVARLEEMLGWVPTSVRQTDLIKRLYQEFGALSRRKVSVAELAALQPFLGAMADSEPDVALAIVGRFGVTDAQLAREVAEPLLRELPHEKLKEAYSGLIAGLSQGCFQERSSERDIPESMQRWLRDLLAEIPDLDLADSHASWWLKEAFGENPLNMASAFDILRRRIELGATLTARYDDDAVRLRGPFLRTWRPIPIGFDFEEIVGGEPSSSGDEERQAFGLLLSAVHAAGGDAYGIEDLLRKIDPDGVVIAPSVAQAIAAADPDVDFDGFLRLSACAAGFNDASPAWRTIAAAAFSKLGSAVDEEHRTHVISTVMSRETREWSGFVGDTLDPRWQAAVDRAKRLLESEDDPLLVPYRKVALRAAEADLEQWRTHAEEADR